MAGDREVPSASKHEKYSYKINGYLTPRNDKHGQRREEYPRRIGASLPPPARCAENYLISTTDLPKMRGGSRRGVRLATRPRFGRALSGMRRRPAEWRPVTTA